MSYNITMVKIIGNYVFIYFYWIISTSKNVQLIKFVSLKILIVPKGDKDNIWSNR